MSAAAALLLAAGLAAPARAEAWKALWVPTDALTFSSAPVELEGKPYATIVTRRFLLYYPARWEGEHDRRLPLHVAARLDNLYDFLAEGAPDKPAEPVKAVLLDGERGNSKTFPETNTIRTGSQAPLDAALGSFFHELAHLFNFAKKDGAQDFWSGELFAQYHADRLQTLGAEHRERYRKAFAAESRRLEWSWVDQLDKDWARLSERERQQLMELGISVYYYLEDAFGREKTLCFQQAHLDPQRRKDPALWESCFGKPYAELRAGWLKYYGL